MKILAVCHEFPPYTGGGIACHDLMAAQSLAGHDVAVFSGGFSRNDDLVCRDELFEWEGAIYSAHTVLVPRDMTLSGNYRPDLLWFAGMDALDAEFTRVLDEFMPDVIHYFHFFQQSVRTLREVKRRGIATVITLLDYHQFCYWMSPFQMHTERYCHDSKHGKDCESCFAYLYLRYVPESVWSDELTEQYVRQRRVLGLAMLESIDRLVSPSCFLKERFSVESSRIGERIEVVNHGLHLTLHKGSAPRSGPAKIFGFFGGANVSKGFFVMLEAITKINDPSLQFHFWGPWGMKNDYGMRDPRIHFHGYVERNQVSTCYSLLDIVVQPSFTENYSTVVREAYACGLPVIAADNTGLPELVTNEKTGLLFKTGSAIDLAQTISSIAEDIELYEKLAVAAYELPVKTVQIEAHEYMEIYEQIMIDQKCPDVLPLKWPGFPEIRLYPMQMLSGLTKEQATTHGTDPVYCDYYDGRIACRAEQWGKAEQLLLKFFSKRTGSEDREIRLDAGFKLCRSRENAGDVQGCKKWMQWLEQQCDELPQGYVKALKELRDKLALESITVPHAIEDRN